MNSPRAVLSTGLAALVSACSLLPLDADDILPPSEPNPPVPFVRSGDEIVDEMLRVARVGRDDIVYDLGCGDGRIVIAAAREFGARAIGIDIDPQRIAEARENARAAGVERRIRFEAQDLFTTDIRDASVVMLFLWPGVNLSLRPKLMRELAPGTRVVSHWHDMGDWKPQQTIRMVSGGRERPIYLWIIPPRSPALKLKPPA